MVIRGGKDIYKLFFRVSEIIDHLKLKKPEFAPLVCFKHHSVKLLRFKHCICSQVQGFSIFDENKMEDSRQFKFCLNRHLQSIIKQKAVYHLNAKSVKSWSLLLNENLLSPLTRHVCLE